MPTPVAGSVAARLRVTVAGALEPWSCSTPAVAAPPPRIATAAAATAIRRHRTFGAARRSGAGVRPPEAAWRFERRPLRAAETSSTARPSVAARASSSARASVATAASSRSSSAGSGPADIVDVPGDGPTSAVAASSAVSRPSSSGTAASESASSWQSGQESRWDWVAAYSSPSSNPRTYAPSSGRTRSQVTTPHPFPQERAAMPAARSRYGTSPSRRGRPAPRRPAPPTDRGSRSRPARPGARG